ncbi:DUF5133 domain-containing protein [Streptomyces monashensis]|uniref:DUF5133 domain-containing protein n=1 Tax=Streptomyces monashensis TaxID=1678012 RepID=UPI0009A1121B|nr:DUF5133 domain-containing protein [Streptomyces monashensis]
MPHRSAWTALLREPANPLSYRRLDDDACALCVLMGQRNAADVVAQAEKLLARTTAEKGRRRAGHARTLIS